MYVAIISGWNPIIAFGNDKKTAKNMAVFKAKRLFKDEPDRPSKWTWDSVQEYYGAYIIKAIGGLALDEEGIKCGKYENNVIYE